MDPSGHQFLSHLASDLLSEAEIEQMRAMGVGRRVGFGASPALLIVDAQNYMVGSLDEADPTEYPAASPAARDALPAIARLLEAFRTARRPVFYTRNVVRPDGRDMGVKGLKRGKPGIEGWQLEGSRGAEITPALAPREEEIVLTKSKQSAFHGTPLLDLLVFARIDTLVLAGGSTSNCVRATAFDSSAHNFRTIVPWDAVFDRIRLSHLVNLMDIDRQMGDVVSSDEVLAYLLSLPQG